MKLVMASTSLGAFFAMAVFAPLLAGKFPLLMTFNERWFFPAFIAYTPEDFGLENELQVPYRELAKTDQGLTLWPLFSSWGPLESDLQLGVYPSPPDSSHIMGTDDRGRDVLARLIHGAKYGLGFALLVWLISYSIGIVLGAVTGYMGGLIDLLAQRCIEVFETIPYLFFVILMVSTFGGSWFLLVSVNVLFGWMMISVYIRGQCLKNKELPFVEGVKALGASKSRVIFCHLLPVSIFPALIFSPMALASYVVTLVQLDFLGMGFQPPTPSWGELLTQANQYFPEAWWLVVFPSACVAVLLVSFQQLGSAIKK